MIQLTEKVLSRFWSYVNKNGNIPAHVPEIGKCWEWTGGTREGYGRLRVGETKQSAHRISWEVHNGEIPKDSIACHKCDNTLCVNPFHLFLGTHKDNSQDRKRKGRNGDIRGVNHPLAKINEEIVRTIRKMCGDGIPIIDVCKQLNLSENIVRFVKHRRSWKHVN